MGVVTAIAAGAAVVGTVGSIAAADAQGKAIGEAGRAELAAREKALAQQIEERKRIEQRATAAAKPSLRELQAADRLIAENDRNLGLAFSSVQKEIATLEEATDPAIKSAGENINNLLKGQAAKALAPLRKQRAQQKAKLENELKARFGSGFRTTSAGIQALQGFDDQTQLLASETQNRALTTISGTFGQLAGARRAGVAGATQLAQVGAQARGTELAGEQRFGERRFQASIAGLGSAVNFGAVADAAAAPFAGDVARAQALGQTFGDLTELGGTVLGKSVGDTDLKSIRKRLGQLEKPTKASKGTA